MHEKYEKFTNCRSISHSMAEMVQCGVIQLLLNINKKNHVWRHVIFYRTIELRGLR